MSDGRDVKIWIKVREEVQLVQDPLSHAADRQQGVLASGPPSLPSVLRAEAGAEAACQPALEAGHSCEDSLQVSLACKDGLHLAISVTQQTVPLQSVPPAPLPLPHLPLPLPPQPAPALPSPLLPPVSPPGVQPISCKLHSLLLGWTKTRSSRSSRTQLAARTQSAA